MRFVTALSLALLLAACGAGRTARTVAPTGPTAAASQTASSPPTTVGPAVSACDYRSPRNGCEPVPAPGSCRYRQAAAGAALPDPACTPGALSLAVTPATVSATICRPGYTKTVRPPVSYTDPLKLRLLRAYGLSASRASGYELDHLVPLEGGGAPADPANLWPEPYAGTEGARRKDRTESLIRERACAGGDLRALQAQIARDWTAVPG